MLVSKMGMTHFSNYKGILPVPVLAVSGISVGNQITHLIAFLCNCLRSSLGLLGSADHADLQRQSNGFHNLSVVKLIKLFGSIFSSDLEKDLFTT
jgi:hypothetical protein